MTGTSMDGLDICVSKIKFFLKSINVKVIKDGYVEFPKKIKIKIENSLSLKKEYFGEIVALNIWNPEESIFNKKIKRIFDFTISTILISLHRLDLLNGFTRIIGIKEGRILLNAEKNKFKKNKLEEIYN